MKKRVGLILAMMIVAASLLAACGKKAPAEPADPAGAQTEASAQEPAAEEGKAPEAEAENAPEEAEAAAPAEEVVPAEPQVYESADGWSVRYDPTQLSVNESDDGVSFVYMGESAGSSLVTIRCVPDKQPEEVLYELTSAWGDEEKIERSEGIFPGTQDKWGYWRVLRAEEGSSGLSETAIAGEYNGGVLLFDILAHVSGDEAIDIPMSDALSELINSITYKDFAPQKMYDYIPGSYVQPYTAVLNEDHTGTLYMPEPSEVLWGSTELIAVDGSFRYEYTVEGSDLMVNVDGNWITFVKESAEPEAAEPEEGAASEAAAQEEDVYLGEWSEQSAERVVCRIDPAGEEGFYDIQVTWREDLPQKDVYDLRAKLQDDGSLYYDNCRYVIRTFEKDGTFSDDLQYEHGSGLFWFDPDAGLLYWTDYEVKPEENVTVFFKPE